MAFHREVFAIEDPSPSTVSELLWRLQSSREDDATERVRGWTRSVLGFQEYATGVNKRYEEASRMAADLGYG